MSQEWYARPVSFAIPAEWGFSAEDRELAEAATWTMILTGEADPGAYVEHLEEELEDAGVSEAVAEAFFASVIAERRVQQERLDGAPESKLTNAFAELETIGVIGREDFTCCGTCGAAEIWDERDDTRAWRGYLFYHTQDAERIPEDRETYVGYGAFLDAYIPEDAWNVLGDAEKESAYAGIVGELMSNEVFPILEKHGIQVTWDGDLGTRILLSDVDVYAEV